MKRTYRNLADLERDYKKAMMDIIIKELRQVITEEWLEEQEMRVYNAYSPKVYSRRREDGGLADPDNIKYMIDQAAKDIYMELTNVTGGNGANYDREDFSYNPISRSDNLNDYIEGEDGFMVGRGGEPLPARPYTEYAVADLKRGISRDNMEWAIMKGLTSRGFNVRLY